MRFWINGAGGSQAVRLVIYQNGVEVGSQDLTPLPAGWTQMTVTWADLGVTATAFDGIIFQANSANADQATAYVDDLELVQAAGRSAAGRPGDGRRRSRPRPPRDQSADLRRQLGRLRRSSRPASTPPTGAAATRTTRYNWLFDTSNRAFDYYFLNISEGSGERHLGRQLRHPHPRRRRRRW